MWFMRPKSISWQPVNTSFKLKYLHRYCRTKKKKRKKHKRSIPAAQVFQLVTFFLGVAVLSLCQKPDFFSYSRFQFETFHNCCLQFNFPQLPSEVRKWSGLVEGDYKCHQVVVVTCPKTIPGDFQIGLPQSNAWIKI